MDRQHKKEEYFNDFKKVLLRDYMTTWDEASPKQLYKAISKVAMQDVAAAWRKTEQQYNLCQLKRVNYFTMENLPGKILDVNLSHLGTKEYINAFLSERRIKLSDLTEQENEPALGNGGLGRLSSCSMESLATMGYNACAYSLKYKNGLFQQKIVDGQQVELPDNWDEDGYPFLIKREEFAQIVTFGSAPYEIKVEAVPYDFPIVAFPTHGFEDVKVSTLRLWDAVNAPEITDRLYPNEQLLRLKQQYVLVSASLQLIVQQFKKQYKDFRLFPEKVCLHINDTHPALVIPELMRILMDEECMNWEKAWAITSKCCSYTNHTIMAEALETWPIDTFEKLLPRVYNIIEGIHHRFEMTLQPEQVKSMAILYDGQIRMANLAIVGSYSVNGVAKLHTEILKSKTFAGFHEIMGEKFNNKTNGVSQRTFLFDANPLLSTWISEKCRTSRWITDMECIKRLEPFADNELAQYEFLNIKYQNKVKFAAEIRKRTGISVDTRAIFDVQIKRQHEYKRQLMNVLRIHYLYEQLKTDRKFFNAFHPMVFIFAGKAHPDYENAKLILHEINKIAKEINNDTSIQNKMKVVFLENYNTTLATQIIPASDVSEQISTASKEASGTSNMKFMMNGAVTIGTLDGANVEIMEAVGRENMFIFGKTADEIQDLEKSRKYIASHICLRDDKIMYAVDKLCPELRNLLLYSQSPTVDADPFFILLDLQDYINTTIELNKSYQNPHKWARMAIFNIANSGRFSIDRTNREYAKEIWHLESFYED